MYRMCVTERYILLSRVVVTASCQEARETGHVGGDVDGGGHRGLPGAVAADDDALRGVAARGVFEAVVAAVSVKVGHAAGVVDIAIDVRIAKMRMSWVYPCALLQTGQLFVIVAVDLLMGSFSPTEPPSKTSWWSSLSSASHNHRKCGSACRHQHSNMLCNIV